MTAMAMSNATRSTVLKALASALKACNVNHYEEHVLPYPIGLPELDHHLELLVELAAEVDLDHNPVDLTTIRERICVDCPYQFPSHCCPAEQERRCTPVRYALPILKAIRDSISKNRTQERTATCYAGLSLPTRLTLESSRP